MNSWGKLLIKFSGVLTNPPEHKNISNNRNTFENTKQESSKVNGM